MLRTKRVQVTVELTEEEHRVLAVEATNHRVDVAGYARSLVIGRAWKLLAEEQADDAPGGANSIPF